MKDSMKALLITEKNAPSSDQRDGGSRVVETLKRFLGDRADILQFGPSDASSSICYPYFSENRFERRLLNGDFIANKVRSISHLYTHLIFIHVSMQFGIQRTDFREKQVIWTFPMFLTPSYQVAGEKVVQAYFEAEKQALAYSDAILTPSPMEKRQLHEVYGVEEEKLFMIPRGVDVTHLQPKKRSVSFPLVFSSVGSIKKQKNTLGVIRLFDLICKKYPGSRLNLIGPVQDREYSNEVVKLVKTFGLEEQISFLGFISPQNLQEALEKSHFHLTASHCETFGRSIFETLALGLPNLIQSSKHNAALDFIGHLPYVCFFQKDQEVVASLDAMLQTYELLSECAAEIGELYDDAYLGKQMLATLFSEETLGVCDFDGTLFHKEDSEKTQRCIDAFRKFRFKIICSARCLSSLQEEMKRHCLEVDWMIANSGAVVADGRGEILWQTPLESRELSHIQRGLELAPFSEKSLLQFSTDASQMIHSPIIREEVYQGQKYCNHWKASKLHALHRLLKEIRWEGKVEVFGDGKYDQEMITYFDGKWITKTPKNLGEREEIYYV